MASPVDKLYFSYEQIHHTIQCASSSSSLLSFDTTLIVAIGGGGFIPARILRTFLRQPGSKGIPIQAIGLSLYEHDDGPAGQERQVRKTQWLTYGDGADGGVRLQGQNILIVDEVDDSRKTLAFAVQELQKDIAAERGAWVAQQIAASGGGSGAGAGGPALPPTPGLSPPDSPTSPVPGDCRRGAGARAPAPGGGDAATAAAAMGWREPRVGVFVVHNKLKAKAAKLPERLASESYWAGAEIHDQWVVYPWDANDCIWEHTRRAHSPGSATQALLAAAAAGGGRPAAMDVGAP